MSIVTTTGLVVFPYKIFPGRMTDNMIMESIFENKDNFYGPFLNLLKNNKIVCTVDRGFIGTENYLKKKQQQDPLFYPNLSFARPVSEKNPVTNQYDGDEADLSRAKVTSISQSLKSFKLPIRPLLSKIGQKSYRPLGNLGHIEIQEFFYIYGAPNFFLMIRTKIRKTETSVADWSKS